MRKRILFVSHSICGGGSEKRLASILRGLDRARFEPHLCVFSLTGKEAQAVPGDVPLYPLSAPLRPASVFLAWELFKLIRELKPDKVFSVLWSVNIIAAAAARAAGVPAVLNEATTPSESVRRYSFPFLRRRLLSAAYRGAEAVIAVSDFAKSDLVDNFGLQDRAVSSVHNGIDAAAAEKAARAYEPGCKNFVLGCGGLNHWKNYSLLISALRGETGAKLVLLGAGPLKDRLEREAAAAGVDLLLPGHLENPYPYFSRASVFVLPSLYEGFPNVICEAMACKTPVVAVDCPGGIREIVKDGITGLIVPQNDPAAMGEAIRKLRTDGALARRLAEAAHANLLENFSFGNMLAGYEKILGA